MGLLEDYERNQQFNVVARWLHTLRYRELLASLRDLPQPFRLLDIGCGPGKLYQVLDSTFDLEYVGVEVEPRFIEALKLRYSGRKNCRIVAESIMKVFDTLGDFDVICALETLEHMPRADVTVLLDKIAARHVKLFFASVPVEIGVSIWLKNVGSAICGYSRHSEYRWRDTFWAGLYRLDKLPPHGTSHIGFDWRWLRDEMTKRFPVRMRKVPLPGLPATSVFFSAREGLG
jgi:SAM-dependent methyltransferase